MVLSNNACSTSTLIRPLDGRITKLANKNPLSNYPTLVSVWRGILSGLTPFHWQRADNSSFKNIETVSLVKVCNFSYPWYCSIHVQLLLYCIHTAQHYFSVIMHFFQVPSFRQLVVRWLLMPEVPASIPAFDGFFCLLS